MTKLLPAGRRHPFNGILRSISLGFAEQTTVRGFKNRLWAVEPSRLFGLLIATCIALPAIVSPVRAVTFEATVRDSISGTHTAALHRRGAHCRSQVGNTYTGGRAFMAIRSK